MAGWMVAAAYAATRDDAEDAYQRGLEILLTKAPTTSEDDLVSWLKTAVCSNQLAADTVAERGRGAGGAGAGRRGTRAAG